MARQLSRAATIDERPLTMTYEEFLAWAGEETRAEWVDGEVIILEMPKTMHQELVWLLAALMSHYARLLDLGRVLISPYEMRLLPVRSSREPDIIFVARDHLDRITVDRLDGPADLVVEIISADSVTRDKRDKLLEYQQAGIPEYWIVDPRERQQTFEPYSLSDRGVYQPILPGHRGYIHSVVLPGFWIDPAWLWQDPMPDPLPLLATIAPDALQALLTPAPPDPGE